MSGINSNPDRIKAEFSTLLNNFTNLVKASKLQDPTKDQASMPGEMLEVFSEKMLASCRALISITSELKRTALLNDIESRSAEVRLGREVAHEENQHYMETEGGKNQQGEESDVSIM
jgi:Surfeit locus protein 5 subunit 22 of Mediator complex